MKIVDYKIIETINRKAHMKDVKSHMKDGWIPLGGCSTINGICGDKYMQTMVKYDD